MISCLHPRGVENTLDDLNKAYRNLNVHDEKTLDYLGMIFDYSVAGGSAHLYGQYDS